MDCDKEAINIAGLAQYRDVAGGNLSICPTGDGRYNVLEGALVVASCKALLDAIIVFKSHMDDTLNRLLEANKEGR